MMMPNCSPSSASSYNNTVQINHQTEIEIPETLNAKNTNRKKENLTNGKNKLLNSQNISIGSNSYYNEIDENSSSNKNNNETNFKSNEIYCLNDNEDETNNNTSNICHNPNLSKNGSNNFNKLYFRLNLNNLNTRNSYVKTGLAIFFAMFAMNSNLVVLAIVHERVPIGQNPLPDLGFDLFFRKDWVLNISEYIIMCETTFLFGMIILHKYRLLLLRRLCLIIGALYIFRSIAMIITVFPLANDKYYCAPQLKPSIKNTITKLQFIGIIFKRVWHMLGGMGLSINGKHNYCGDYMYSGHTVMLTLSYLFIREYLFPYRLRTLYLKLANLFIFSCSCTGVICIIISRGHYLIDIVVAYYITTRIFWIYHTMAYNRLLMTKSSFNYLSKVWWFSLFQYFEYNCENLNNLKNEPINQNHCSCSQPKYCDCVIANIPRIFEWPLPWPRLLRKRSALLPCHQRLLPQQHA